MIASASNTNVIPQKVDTNNPESYEEYERLQSQLKKINAENDSLKSRVSSMERLEESRDIYSRKESALGKSQSSSQLQNAAKSNGYQIWHLIFVALLSLIIGALMTSMRAQSNVPVVPSTI